VGVFRILPSLGSFQIPSQDLQYHFRFLPLSHPRLVTDPAICLSGKSVATHAKDDGQTDGSVAVEHAIVDYSLDLPFTVCLLNDFKDGLQKLWSLDPLLEPSSCFPLDVHAMRNSYQREERYHYKVSAIKISIDFLHHSKSRTRPLKRGPLVWLALSSFLPEHFPKR
jgi:hypothetical protein